jgi:DNA-binding beta-propeller fold protein YncE
VNTDGSLGTCELFTGNSTFNQPVFITFNTAKNFAYIANYNSDSVSVCQVNSTGVLGACTLSAGNGTFASPSGVAINAAGTFAYVANNFNNTVSLCPMVGNGLFGTCTTSSGNLTFSTPQAVTLHATGNPAVTYLYVPNGDGSVSICPVNSDGSLGVCIISNGNGTFLSPKGVSFNAAGTFAYIPSRATNAVSICPLNSDGTFGVCTTTTGNGTFNFTATAVTGLFMSGTSNFGYIPNDSTSLVSICPISTADGTLGTCVSTDGNSTFDLSSSIYISSFAVS